MNKSSEQVYRCALERVAECPDADKIFQAFEDNSISPYYLCRTLKSWQYSDTYLAAAKTAFRKWGRPIRSEVNTTELVTSETPAPTPELAADWPYGLQKFFNRVAETGESNDLLCMLDGKDYYHPRLGGNAPCSNERFEHSRKTEYYHPRFLELALAMVAEKKNPRIAYNLGTMLCLSGVWAASHHDNFLKAGGRRSIFVEQSRDAMLGIMNNINDLERTAALLGDVHRVMKVLPDSCIDWFDFDYVQDWGTIRGMLMGSVEDILRIGSKYFCMHIAGALMHTSLLKAMFHVFELAEALSKNHVISIAYSNTTKNPEPGRSPRTAMTMYSVVLVCKPRYA